MKVLIVDDSAMLRTVVKKAVASMGVENIVEAGDGVEALKALESGDVDLIFSDWNMPNMTAWSSSKRPARSTAPSPSSWPRPKARKRRSWKRSPTA